MKNLSFAISPCPNDTFSFYHLLYKQGFLNECHLYIEDIAKLNHFALENKKDILKTSFFTFAKVLKNYALFSSGAALGYNCGPLLVKKKGSKVNFLSDTILIPGEFTSANFLLHLFLQDKAETKSVLFSEIIKKVSQGEYKMGLIIHESRFTYQDFDIELIQDLGQYWEEKQKTMIPLGGIIAKKNLGKEFLQKFNKGIKTSIQWAKKNPQDKGLQKFIRDNAQEIKDNIIQQHIETYVNDESIELSKLGSKSIEVFLKLMNEKNFINKLEDFFLIQ